MTKLEELVSVKIIPYVSLSDDRPSVVATGARAYLAAAAPEMLGLLLESEDDSRTFGSEHDWRCRRDALIARLRKECGLGDAERDPRTHPRPGDRLLTVHGHELRVKAVTEDGKRVLLWFRRRGSHRELGRWCGYANWPLYYGNESTVLRAEEAADG